MKYVLIFLGLALLGCEMPEQAKREIQQMERIEQMKPPLDIIGEYRTRSGTLTVIVFNKTDTLYIMEGRDSSYPISIQLKK